MAPPIEQRVEAALTCAEKASKDRGIRMKEAVTEAVTDLCFEIQEESNTLVERANQSVQRAVNNAYEDAKAVCMGLRPPAHDAAEAITKRQKEVMGETKESSTPESEAPDPLDATLWQVD